MNTAPHNSYLEGMVLGAEPLHLVCIVYGSAIQSVQTARQCLQSGDVATRGRAVDKALDAVALLISSLNTDEGGEIGSNLLALYLYLQRRLLEANIHQSDSLFAEVEELLNALQPSWAELARNPELAAA